jgi:hypothetical protein
VDRKDTCQHGAMAAHQPQAADRPNGKAGPTPCAWQRLSLIGVLALAACSSPRAPAPASPQAPSPVTPQTSTTVTPQPPSTVSPQAPLTATPPRPPALSSTPYRNWDEFRLHAGRRLVQANPNGTYTGAVPEPLLAIPVLEVELNADGSVRRILVQRHPTQARDTVQLAIDAVQRAAPFGDISHLPRPWKFSEVFLFRDDRRFKPRVLDL